MLYLFKSRRRHTRWPRDWSSDVCSSDLSADAFTEMIGTFEIKTNERNVLSLTLTNYAIAYHYAHGLTLKKRSEERRVGKDRGKGCTRRGKKRRKTEYKSAV